MGLYDELEKLYRSDMLPLHMPGHKRSAYLDYMSDIYAHDITEIDGFDDLHHPSGIIRELEERAAALYGADRAWISVNGSTAANESAILGVCNPGDTVIVPRASHRSVYYALEIGRLYPWFVSTCRWGETSVYYPPTADEIRGALRACPGCKCVVITSPTYEGVMADVEGIAKEVHKAGAILIVDSAHGAHIGLKGDVTTSPIHQGADIMIVSLHKMLPAPTQTALMMTSPDAASRGVSAERLSHFMEVFISSSPSYVLMAGVEACIEYMEKEAVSGLARMRTLLEAFRKDCSGLRHISTEMVEPDSDPFKVVLRTGAGIGGYGLYLRLRNEYHIQCELAGAGYALALFSVMDDRESLDRFSSALHSIDDDIERSGMEESSGTAPHYKGRDDMYADHIPVSLMTPGEAYTMEKEMIPLNEDAIGRISGAYVCIYPPGVPLIVPGEVIDRTVINIYNKEVERKLGMTGAEDGCIPVIRN